MDIEEFLDQPYTDRQLVKFVDDSKLEKKSLLVAILENDKLFDASTAGIVGATRLISTPIGLAALGIKKLSNNSKPDLPKSESDNLLQFSSLKQSREHLLTSLNERKSDIKLIRSTRKKGVVITFIGKSYIEHFKLMPSRKLCKGDSPEQIIQA